MQNLDINSVHHGRAEDLIKLLPVNGLALSFWSPPYFVGKDYEKDETFQSWQMLLRSVIHGHTHALKAGGFLVINIADILCFKDASIPRFQAQNLAHQRTGITKEMVLAAKTKHPTYNRYQLAEFLGCSEQTIDRRLNGNNIRGGKYEAETRVKLVGGDLEQYAYEAGLFLYDRRIWVKDAAWANSRWTSTSLRAVDEFEYLYVFWKPGQQIIDRSKLSSSEWSTWGSRAVWYIDSVRRNDDHEAKFPLQLAERVIRLYSEPNDLVLDPFLGSGTTAIAAIRQDRNFIGFEKESKYVDLARSKIREARRQVILPFVDGRELVNQ